MALDLAAIKTGIYSAFTGNAPAVAALLGGLRDTEQKPAPLYPHAVYQYITGVPWPTFDRDGEVITYQFSVYNQSEKQRDFTVLDDAVKKLTTVFDDATLTIADHTCIEVTRLESGYLPTVDQTQGFFINYLVRIQDD